VLKWTLNLINTGAFNVKDPEEVKRIRLSNLIALTVLVTGTPFVFIFYLLCSKMSGIALVGYILSFLIVFYLNRRQRFIPARLVMLFLLNIAVIHYSWWFGADSKLHFMLIPFSCVPFLICKREKRVAIASSVTLSFSGFLLIEFFTPAPFLYVSPDALDFVSKAIMPIFLAWILLVMVYLSAQTAMSLEALKNQRIRHMGEIVNTQEKERVRIARDVHDSLGQVLLAIKINLERHPDRDRGSPVSTSIELADQAVSEIRNISYNLMPSTLEQHGLIPAIEEMVSRVHQLPAQKVQFFAQGFENLQISKEKEYNIYRIIQESLNNVVKHAQATEVSIQLICANKTMTIVIEDDGLGFDHQSEINHGNGSGLRNISARTEWMEGTCIIDSGPNRGTTLIVEIPLTQLPD
jgi:signal transduction histidine kinase